MSKLNTTGMKFYELRDEKSYNELYKIVLPIVSSYMFKNIYDPDNRKLVTDRVMVILWNNIHMYNPEYKFSTFLFAVMNNERRNYLKKYNNNQLTFSDTMDTYSSDDTVSSTDRKKLYRDVIERIKALPEPNRSLILEKFLYGKELSELAIEYNLNLSQVKHRIYTTLKRMRKESCI